MRKREQKAARRQREEQQRKQREQEEQEQEEQQRFAALSDREKVRLEVFSSTPRLPKRSSPFPMFNCYFSGTLPTTGALSLR